jgi:alkylhydroperoxidase/carboxymuconolactone decarboxylase family protein YurZ
MGQTARFRETFRRLMMIDEGFAEDEAGLGLGPAGASVLDARTAALLPVGVAVAIGSSPPCLEWSIVRALAADASEDEIAEVEPTIAPVAGVNGVVTVGLTWQPHSGMTSRQQLPDRVPP